MMLGRHKSVDYCSLCGNAGTIIFFRMNSIPCSCNTLWSNKEEAINCPKGDILLGFCPSCTFISNYALEADKNRYEDSYDNSLLYSPLFQHYAESTVSNLINRFNLQNRTILEITVGKVDFLSLFCSLAPNKGLKLHPSIIDNHLMLKKINEFSKHINVDFVFSFHDLEHSNDPTCFLKMLKNMVGSRTVFFFSVPNIYRAFSTGEFTDVMYEHTSYFTIPSLRYLFNTCGYEVIEIFEDTGGLYNSIDIVASIPKNKQSVELPLKKDSKEIAELIQVFALRSKEVITRVCLEIRELLDKGKSIVVWGAGARGVTLLNMLRDNRIRFVVDINPNKQGKFVPGTGQEIVAPDFLVSHPPDYVFIINDIYKDEIRKLLERLHIKSEILLLNS